MKETCRLPLPRDINKQYRCRFCHSPLFRVHKSSRSSSLTRSMLDHRHIAVKDLETVDEEREESRPRTIHCQSILIHDSFFEAYRLTGSRSFQLYTPRNKIRGQSQSTSLDGYSSPSLCRDSKSVSCDDCSQDSVNPRPSASRHSDAKQSSQFSDSDFSVQNPPYRPFCCLESVSPAPMNLDSDYESLDPSNSSHSGSRAACASSCSHLLPRRAVAATLQSRALHPHHPAASGARRSACGASGGQGARAEAERAPSVGPFETVTSAFRHTVVPAF